jgi:hypothetical protein
MTEPKKPTELDADDDAELGDEALDKVTGGAKTTEGAKPPKNTTLGTVRPAVREILEKSN